MSAPLRPDENDRGVESVGSGTDVGRLTRWLAAGGGWQVIADTSAGLTVALLRCDGGEEMERIVSTDRTFLAYVDGLSRHEP